MPAMTREFSFGVAMSKLRETVERGILAAAVDHAIPSGPCTMISMDHNMRRHIHDADRCFCPMDGCMFQSSHRRIDIHPLGGDYGRDWQGRPGIADTVSWQ